MKKVYPVEEPSLLPHHHVISTTTSTEPPINPPTWLTLVLERLNTYFHTTVTPDDLDLLNSSLYHLYQRVDTLYCISLPSIESTIAGSGKQQSVEHHYHLWLDLQTVQHQLEHIEILCHLLNASVYNILLCLDSCHNTTMQDEVETNTISENIMHTLWTNAFTVLLKQTEQWQCEHRSFLALFSDLALTLPKLEQFDKRCVTLLESARTIFADILPDTQALSQGDNEAAAVLLLDLLQQSDQIVLQIATLLDVLQPLIKHYAIRADE